ncbi:MAG TPA: NTPase [Terriglobia bacterium]
MAALKLFITGKPGVGKTTVVERVMRELRESTRMAGFVTEEMRGPTGERWGFDITTVEGKRGQLARIRGLGPVRGSSRSVDLSTFERAPLTVRVGRYGVDVEAFERVALPELARRDVDLMVIDEIGKMECASKRFCHAVEEVLDADLNILATLGIGRHPFFQVVRSHPDVELIRLTEGNRDAVFSELSGRLREAVRRQR